MAQVLLPQLEILQKMIDLKIQKLGDLREKHLESRSELYTSEIDVIEGKLVMVFVKQILTKIKHSHALAQESSARYYPRLRQFLFVVDIEEEMVQALEERCSTVEELLTFSDEKLRGIFYVHDDNEETKKKLDWQYSKLRMARNIMQSYVFRLQNGEKRADLQWSSWFDTVPDSPSPSVRSSIASHLSVFAYTSPGDGSLSVYKSRSIPPSPSAARSHSTIPRSISAEPYVGQHVHSESTSSAGSIGSASRYKVSSDASKHKKNKPGVLTIPPNTDGEGDSSDHSKSRSSSISQSPRTPTVGVKFSHSIKHRFSGKQLLVSIACGYCERVMFFGLKCKECGFKCHKKCSRKVPPSCGLPDDLLRVFKETIDKESREGLKRTISDPSYFANRIKSEKNMPMNRSHGSLSHNLVRDQGAVVQGHDTYSTASSTSSMSSSPFNSDSPLGTPNQPDAPNEQADNKFPFFIEGDGFNHDNLLDTLVSTTSTVSTLNSETSTDTLIDSRVSKSSNDTKSSSTVSIQEDDVNNVNDLDVQISDIPIYKHVKLRNHGSLMSEWVIPYNQIEQGELVGVGRVGKVYKAKWHGECALKVLYLENPTVEEKSDFKHKVQVLRRTRHENLILFMGACMEPPTLAIVCSLCKGSTLYQHIHIYGTKFDDVKLVSIVQQIAQGMSYLHARKIVHRDLKSKNIFLENNRIVITDFGLISVADVKVTNIRKNYLLLPQGWLCYQAPEIIRCLSAYDPGCEIEKYTKETDIYAFGSVWFELLAGQWPFSEYPVESIIWQIGKGVKQKLAGLDITREAKDIISMVWAHDPENRPQFSMLLKAFERLPKKRLIRSPSQPTYLTRSADALLI